MNGYPVPQRQGEQVSEGGDWQDSWVLFTEFGANHSLLRPQNGSIILYNRKKVKYRKDGYLWKKRKDGKTTREDHMKLKVQGMEVSEASSSSALACPPFTLSLVQALPGLGDIILLSTLPVMFPFSLTLHQLADGLAHFLLPISIQDLGHPSPAGQ